MSGRLNNKIAIVTGGASGIGEAIAKRFMSEGAQVAIADIDAALGEQVLASIRGAGGEAHFTALDVRDADAVQAFVQATVDRYGGLDIVVNNVGIGIGKNVEQTELDEWHNILSTNTTSTFLVTKYAVAPMRARGGGTIINIGSFFGLRASPSFSAYHASKGAIRMFTKSTALALAPDGIRVNTVHPGFIITPASQREPTAQAMSKELLGPMGRWGEASEVAAACLFLASDEASFVTGVDLPVDGGLAA